MTNNNNNNDGKNIVSINDNIEPGCSIVLLKACWTRRIDAAQVFPTEAETCMSKPWKKK